VVAPKLNPPNVVLDEVWDEEEVVAPKLNPPGLVTELNGNEVDVASGNWTSVPSFGCCCTVSVPNEEPITVLLASEDD